MQSRDPAPPAHEARPPRPRRGPSKDMCPQAPSLSSREKPGDPGRMDASRRPFARHVQFRLDEVLHDRLLHDVESYLLLDLAIAARETFVLADVLGPRVHE